MASSLQNFMHIGSLHCIQLVGIKPLFTIGYLPHSHSIYLSLLLVQLWLNDTFSFVRVSYFIAGHLLSGTAGSTLPTTRRPRLVKCRTASSILLTLIAIQNIPSPLLFRNHCMKSGPESRGDTSSRQKALYTPFNPIESCSKISPLSMVKLTSFTTIRSPYLFVRFVNYTDILISPSPSSNIKMSFYRFSSILNQAAYQRLYDQNLI